LQTVNAVHTWIGRLPQWNLVEASGRAKTTRYFISPDMLRRMDFSATTTLRRIEPHRLRALILEDLSRYPRSAIGDIQKRTAPEVSRSRIKRSLDELVEQGTVVFEGEKRWRRYWILG